MTTNQQAAASEWVATAHRSFPSYLVRLPGSQYRDVVPERGRRVAHDAFHHVARLDRADADGHHAAGVPGGPARRGAGRHREPPPAARHPGADPGRRQTTRPVMASTQAAMRTF